MLISFVLQIICSFLFAMGLLFIIIELRAKFDKSFLIFGVTTLLLASFCAIDIWMQPKELIVSWTKLQHSIFCFSIPFYYWYLMLLLGKVRKRVVQGLFFFAVIFTALFSTSLMFNPHDGLLETKLLYNLLFVPYTLINAMAIIAITIYGTRCSAAPERQVFIYHIIGFGILTLFGTADMFELVFRVRSTESYTTIGVLALGSITAFIFVERLSLLVREREITYNKLQTAYKELSESLTLRELGMSTAIINHEIKNYTFIISGFAEITKQLPGLGEQVRQRLDKIIHAANKLTQFSQEILDFSKCRIVRDKTILDIRRIIKSTAANHFPRNEASFFFEGFETEQPITGNWAKLEQVFINIFKNSLEADAEHIHVSLLKSDGVLLVSIEDDGTGCSEDQLKSMFKAFYTSKKKKRGTGLGTAIIRSIVESHGGSINTHSKNLLGKGKQGLILNITFPVYRSQQTQPAPSKHNIVVLKKGIKDLSLLIKIFQNAGINPHVLQDVPDLINREFPPDKMVVLAKAESIDKLQQGTETPYRVHTLIETEVYGIYVAKDSDTSSRRIFSEEFLINDVLPQISMDRVAS